MLNLDTCDRNVDALDYKKIEEVGSNMGENTNFSSDNRKYLLEYFNKVENCKCILEIGVQNNEDKDSTSTSVFLKNKKDDTIYIGVDIEDKSYLNNPDKNIYTIQTGSENIQEVMNFVRSKGIDKIDFLFIDGWHSINQCIIEFEGYTPYLSNEGIVGVHDTTYHPGPRWLVEKTDKNIWNIAEHRGKENADFGISFIWRK